MIDAPGRLWRRLVALLSRRRPTLPHSDLTIHDRRLDAVERDLEDLEARLRALDYEANIRGER